MFLFAFLVHSIFTPLSSITNLKKVLAVSMEIQIVVIQMSSLLGIEEAEP
jgi:hypothetical protein